MTAPPRLTDHDSLARQRARALRRADSVAAELHREIAQRVDDRLSEVNKSFTTPAVVTPYPHLWAETLPGARLVPDAPVLDLAEASHDLIIHAMALHWADDPLGQIIQCRRALKPDGLFIAVMPGGRTLQELRAALAQAESDLYGSLSPRVLPMTDLRDAGALLQRAGLALPVADLETVPLAYRRLDRLVADLRSSGEGNALAARHRRAMPRALWAAAQALYAGNFGRDGLFPATLELIWLTGWAPHDSQPQALRPGSATTRLAQALGTDEMPLPPKI